MSEGQTKQSQRERQHGASGSAGRCKVRCVGVSVMAVVGDQWLNRAGEGPSSCQFEEVCCMEWGRRRGRVRWCAGVVGREVFLLGPETLRPGCVQHIPAAWQAWQAWQCPEDRSVSLAV